MIELAPPCCITIIALLLRQAWAGLTKQRVAMGAQFRRTCFKHPKTADELLAWATTFETEMRLYTDQSGEEIPESVKVATVLNGLQNDRLLQHQNQL